MEETARDGLAVARPLVLGSFFPGLPQEARARIMAMGRVEHRRDGAWIHQRGDHGKFFSIIERGAVRFSRLGLSGEVRVLATLGTGEAFGELPLFAGVPRAYDAQAIGDTMLRILSHDEMDRLLAEDGEVRSQVLRHVSRQLLIVLELLEDERSLPLRARLGKSLLAMLRQQDGAARIRIRQSDLAEQHAVSLVALSKALAELRGEGLVMTGYGWIDIPSERALTQWLEAELD
ncbi:MAG: Crp/Fnr family transcriptional regulator [Blastomonas sp.]